MLSHEEQLLISAYVDGEAAAQERARAEQLLVDKAEARAYRGELLAMSAKLQSLARHRLPSGFAEQVLQAAEREMFVGKPWPGEQAVGGRAKSSIPEYSFNSRERWLRRLAYAGATIAAAILVSMFLPNDEQPIAQHKANESADRPANKPAAGDAKPSDAQIGAPQRDRAEADDAASQDGEDRGDGLSNAAAELAAPKPAAPAESRKAETLAEKTLTREGGKSGPRGQELADKELAGQSTQEGKADGVAKRAAEPPLLVVTVDIADAARLKEFLAASKIESQAIPRGARPQSKEAGKLKASEELKEGETLAAKYGSPKVFAEMTRLQLEQVIAQLKSDPARPAAVAVFGGAGARGQQENSKESDQAESAEPPGNAALADKDLKSTADESTAKGDTAIASADKKHQQEPAAGGSPATGRTAGAKDKQSQVVRVLFVLNAPVEQQAPQAAERAAEETPAKAAEK